MREEEEERRRREDVMESYVSVRMKKVKSGRIIWKEWINVKEDAVEGPVVCVK